MTKDLNKTCQVELHEKEFTLHGSIAAIYSADEQRRQSAKHSQLHYKIYLLSNPEKFNIRHFIRNIISTCHSCLWKVKLI